MQHRTSSVSLREKIKTWASHSLCVFPQRLRSCLHCSKVTDIVLAPHTRWLDGQESPEGGVLHSFSKSWSNVSEAVVPPGR